MTTNRAPRRSRALDEPPHVKPEEQLGAPSVAKPKPLRQRPRSADQKGMRDSSSSEHDITPDTTSREPDVKPEVKPARPRNSGKRKREPGMTAHSREGVRATEPYMFFARLAAELLESEDCEEFRQPVLKKYKPRDVPDYRSVITTPMDLGTINSRISSTAYIKEYDHGRFRFDEVSCGKDVMLVFENCMTYNQDTSDIFKLARKLKESVNQELNERDAKKASLADFKVRREQERRRRVEAEEKAKTSAEQAAYTAAALSRTKKEAEQAKRKRELEIKQRDIEWQKRLKVEKEAAVQQAVKELIATNKVSISPSAVGLSGPATADMTAAAAAAAVSAAVHGQGEASVPAMPPIPDEETGDENAKIANTSSVSSDEHEGFGGDISFAFVSTKGMEKKRGRKSTRVTDLETQHESLMKRRKGILERAMELEKFKQVQMTFNEKKVLCDDVAELDFIRMKGVVDILSRGMNRPDMMSEVEIDMDVDHVDNAVLREIQFFLKNPSITTAKDGLRKLEANIADIETKLVHIRYQKVNS